MITKLRVKNFKALRDIEVKLTPIHVLIGPNDSGKTSILDVMTALCRTVNHNLEHAFLGLWKGRELVWAGDQKLAVDIEVDFDDAALSGYGLSVQFGMRGRKAIRKREFLIMGGEPVELQDPLLHENSTLVSQLFPHSDDTVHYRGDEVRRVGELLSGIHYYRWNPAFLGLPVAPDAKRRFRMESNGFGLALCLDEILNFDRDRFIELENRFIELFPEIKSIKLQQEEAYRAPIDNPDRVTMLNKADGKGLYLQMNQSGQLIPASQASDGTLLVLAYLSILNLPEPPRLLLIEEPENGIHPSRLRDVLGILRELVREQSHTQVILTTHSPYVLDLFEPEEVTLCTKADTGEIQTTLLSESPKVDKLRKVFTLGEIWTSEGDSEIAEHKAKVERTGE